MRMNSFSEFAVLKTGKICLFLFLITILCVGPKLNFCICPVNRCVTLRYIGADCNIYIRPSKVKTSQTCNLFWNAVCVLYGQNRNKFNWTCSCYVRWNFYLCHNCTQPHFPLSRNKMELLFVSWLYPASLPLVKK